MTPDPAKSACVLHASFSVRICGWFDFFCHQVSSAVMIRSRIGVPLSFCSILRIFLKVFIYFTDKLIVTFLNNYYCECKGMQ